MDLYQEIAGRRCITRDDFKNLTGTDSAADWHIRTFLEKGYIERVRHDLYAVISLETGQPIANRFQIASAAAGRPSAPRRAASDGPKTTR